VIAAFRPLEPGTGFRRNGHALTVRRLSNVDLIPSDGGGFLARTELPQAGHGREVSFRRGAGAGAFHLRAEQLLPLDNFEQVLLFAGS